MCGFVGVLGPDRDEAEAAARGALASIRHRGPDDYGYLTVALGSQWLSVSHSRLSILDVSNAGRQPMVRGPLPAGARATRVNGDRENGEDELGIVFNGEIYNFPELHTDLSRRPSPQQFSSRCDTEVVLHGIARDGLDFVEHLRGMYAFALWEPAAARLHFVRDRLGIKPLYYCESGERVIFGSEVRALLATGLVRREIDRVGLERYLAFGASQDPHTLIEGVHALEPSHSLTIEAGRRRAPRRYWQLPIKVDRTITREEAVTETRRLVKDAVECHLLSDVRVGAFLSGGLDSSIIVALMSNARQGPQHAVTVVSDDGGRASREDAAYASLVSTRFGVQHHVLHLSASVADRHVRRAVELMDQPSIDGPNTFVVSGAAREAGCVVALSGLGADEVFNGYTSFQTLPYVQRLTHVRGIGTAAHLLRARLPATSVRASKLAEMAAAGGDLATLTTLQRTLFMPRIRQLLIRPDYRTTGGVTFQPPLANDEIPEDPLNYISACELRGYLQNMLLRDCDGMSMAHSLELRVPFLDHRLVEFALSLPGSFKSKLFQQKSLLRSAMKPLLPRAVFRRPKIGFNLAFPQWMRTSLRGTVELALLRDHPVLDTPTVTKLWNTFVTGGDDRLWTRLWGLYTLTAWLDRHVLQTGREEQASGHPDVTPERPRPGGVVQEMRTAGQRAR
jgi:asparagine synthase (glutamine-hydrolysing)